MEEKSKITTKEYYACGTCKEKMETMNIGGSYDFLGFATSKSALYCNKKECEKFGYLTVVGIKVQES